MSSCVLAHIACSQPVRQAHGRAPCVRFVYPRSNAAGVYLYVLQGVGRLSLRSGVFLLLHGNTRSPPFQVVQTCRGPAAAQ